MPQFNEAQTRQQFKVFAERHRLNAAQLRFLRAVQSVFLEQRRLALADLYDAPPLQAFGMDAVEYFFDEEQQQAILEFTDTLVT